MDYIRIEKMVLEHVKWNLLLPTAADFVDYYIRYLITEKDNIECNNNTADLWQKGKESARRYLDCVKEGAFYKINH